MRKCVCLLVFRILTIQPNIIKFRSGIKKTEGNFQLEIIPRDRKITLNGGKYKIRQIRPRSSLERRADACCVRLTAHRVVNKLAGESLFHPQLLNCG